MRNRTNVLVGAPDVKAAGGIRVGDANPDVADYPTSAVSETPAGLELAALGFVSEDGVTKTVERSTEKIKDWNGDTILITQTDHSVTLQMTLKEAGNAEVLKLIAGDDNVTIAGDSITVDDTADELPHRCIQIDIRSSATSKVRLFAADAQVTSVGDVTFVRGNTIEYQVTFELFPDVNDVKLRQFIEKNYTGAVEGDPEG